MGVLTYIKIGVAVALLGVASYFVLNYRHMQSKIATLQTQVVEQHKVIAWYEKAAKVDKETADVHQEIQKAADSNDVPHLLDLYRQLQQHQRSPKSKTPAKAKHAPKRIRDDSDS